MTVYTFAYSGVEVAWEVPAGVTSITVDCRGGRGGEEYAGTTLHGKGARVQCDLSVTPGEILWLYVGGRGFDGNGAGTGSTGGFNGGGDGDGGGGFGSGGGGGASDIRQGGQALGDRVVVAGGGGGAGANNTSTSFGGGGDAGTNGSNGQDGQGGPTKGSGATTSAGGAAGTPSGVAGSLGVGGDGANTGLRSGGGGGGGLYGGGGGGGSNTPGTSGGGGGGGSSLSTGVSSTITAGYNDDYGLIVLTFTETAHTAETAPCVGDRFDKANSASSAGTADTGQSWTARSRLNAETLVVTAETSVLGIVDNQAYDPTGDMDRVNIVTIDHGFADVDASLVVTAPLAKGEQVDLVYRLADDSHLWWLFFYRSVDSGVNYAYFAFIRQLNGSGSYSDPGGSVNLGTTPQFPVQLRVLAVGDRHRAYVNGVEHFDFTDSFNQTETEHGLGMGPSQDAPISRVNDYRACPVSNPWNIGFVEV